MKKTLNGIFVILFLALLVSCGDVARSMGIGQKNVDVYFHYERFKEEKSLWNSSKPPNYQFNLETDIHDNSNKAGFSANTLIIVEKGKYKTQIPNYTFEETGYTSKSSRNETINDIYEYIESEYLRFHNKKPASRGSYLTEIEIEYDIKNHIPVTVRMWYTNPAVFLDSSAYDDTIKITGYKVND
jgi:hypothetical protein